VCVVGAQYEQLNDMQVQFESSLQRQNDLHAKFDLSFAADNLKVAALQAEEHAETVAEQFLSGIFTYFDWLLQLIVISLLCMCLDSQHVDVVCHWDVWSKIPYNAVTDQSYWDKYFVTELCR